MNHVSHNNPDTFTIDSNNLVRDIPNIDAMSIALKKLSAAMAQHRSNILPSNHILNLRDQNKR